MRRAVMRQRVMPLPAMLQRVMRRHAILLRAMPLPATGRLSGVKAYYSFSESGDQGCFLSEPIAE